MFLCIDIGGTKTLIACISARGRISHRDKFPTPKNLNDFLNKLFIHLKPYQRYSPESIVVAIPGLVQNNQPLWFGNRPWKNPPIARCIKKLFSCPVYLENDANLATVFESKFYSGVSVYLTFSTGIGGGIAERSHLIQPASNDFEPGHKLYLWDNHSLEWEDIASCNAIGARFGVQATSVRGKDNYAEIAKRLALGLTDVIQTYRPETIIIGGPLARRFIRFRTPLRKELKSALPRLKKLPRLVPAKYPTESVIHGMHLYALQKAQGNE